MKLTRSLACLVARFRKEERGAVLAETLIVVPFVTFFSVGILEFGNMFWQKEQIEVGLRDAARYLARCQTATSFNSACGAAGETVRGETNAREIAFYGTASPVVGTTPLRVPGFGPTAADIVITQPVAGVIRLTASHGYESSPLFFWLTDPPYCEEGEDCGIGPITIQAFHEQRYIGW